MVMAFTRLSLSLFGLLLSLSVLAFADKSSKYGFPSEGEAMANYGEKPRVYKTEVEVEVEPEHEYGSKPNTYKRKSEGETTPEYDSNTEGETKPNYGEKPGVHKTEVEVEVEAEHNYGEKPSVYKTEVEVEPEHEYGSMSEGEEKPDYDANPSAGYKPNLNEEEAKPDNDANPSADYKPNLNEEDANVSADYKPNPNEEDANPSADYKPNPNEEDANVSADYKPNPNEEDAILSADYKPNPNEKAKPYNDAKSSTDYKTKPLTIGVQGFVLCKSGSKYYPIQGALANVKCVGVDELGVDKIVPICNMVTDAKGYFFTAFSSLNLKDCKAFLEKSPLESCKVPSDVNKGISGAPFSSYRVLNQKHTILYSLKPFFFTSETNSVPNGY